jgi:hypothetical protein
MNFVGLLYDYVAWHYSKALSLLLKNAGNLIWFVWHFFSIPILLATFFSPWHRLQEERDETFSFGNFFSIILMNLILRIVGIIIRVIFISIGLVGIVSLCLLTLVSVVIWILLPVVLVMSIIFAFVLLFKAS